IKDLVHRLEAEIRHADGVKVGIAKRDPEGRSTLHYPALFAGKFLSIAFGDFHGSRCRVSGDSAWKILRPSPDTALLPLYILEECLEFARAGRMAQLAKRLGFNLANTLASDGEVLAHFFQSVFRATAAETETHLDHFFLAWGQRRQNLVGDLAQV